MLQEMTDTQSGQDTSGNATEGRFLWDEHTGTKHETGSSRQTSLVDPDVHQRSPDENLYPVGLATFSGSKQVEEAVHICGSSSL